MRPRGVALLTFPSTIGKNRGMSTMALPAKPFLSVGEAAELLGVTDSRIRQMLREEELLGLKLNERAWAVDRSSAEKALKNQVDGGRGRPRNGAA